MEDSCHLERMGRELKCPICLSLLDSAVSLTCNHVFCNCCIHKSMRRGSNCPVCKVPYQRREIRPAPHMDNLVNIYKSMEVASGLSLFISQNPPAIKSSEKPNGGDSNAKSSGERPETVKIRTVKGVRAKTPARNRQKPSFQTNKRVQVPQSPTTETPIPEAMCHSGKSKIINDIDGKSSDTLDEHPPLTRNENPFLPPFFWLREDEDRPSQQTDEDHLTGTPVKAPSFSDIMDSDDDVPSKSSPEEGILRKCNNGSIFDSEMFEWTQRPCSPELCSTPVKMQGAVGDSRKFNGMDVEDVVVPSISNTKVVNEYRDNINTFEKSGNEDCEFQNDPPGSKKPRKCSKVGKKSKIQQLKKIMGHVKDAHDGSDTCDCTTQNENVGSIYTKSLKEVDDAVVSELHASSKGKRGPRKGSKSNNSKRKYEKVNQRHTVGTQKHKKQKCNTAISDTIEAEVIARDGRQEDTMSKPSSSTKNSGKKASTTAKDVEGTPKSENLGASLRIGKVHFQKDMPLLHKHNATPKCAFCHSAEEMEATGEMVHYSDGRLVLEDHKGGPVIHSHKNCTEWAPNVYFEDDNVINLEEELARSRRIKCSLCGERGAALGCYETSCRKSFHVPCAKLLQKCRWDSDHFVILCSLHAASKLPCELSTSQVKKERSNRKFLRQQSQVAVARSNKNMWISSQKLVLCCSVLAYAEKETVSEFAKLSGTVISTSWDSSVTHVIASIDENEACKRTIKVLMGILEGKWIVSIKWIQACMKENKLVDETPYEINHDIHGVKDGPSRGRSRLQNKERKLFAGFKFYFSGDFAPSYKGYLQDLVTAAGGIVLHRKPVAEAGSSAASKSTITPTVIVYNTELPDPCDISNKGMIIECRRLDAETLAHSSGCRVATNSWILNSVAGHKLQDL